MILSIQIKKKKFFFIIFMVFLNDFLKERNFFLKFLKIKKCFIFIGKKNKKILKIIGIT